MTQKGLAVVLNVISTQVASGNYAKCTSKKLVNGQATLIFGLDMFAKLLSLSRPRRRSASTSTHSKTSPSSLTTLWTLWVRSSDNVLSNWQHQPSHFYNFWLYRARKLRKLNNRHLAHHVSPHHAFGLSKTSVNGTSSLLVSGTLRSRVTQHSESPCCTGCGHRAGPQ